MTYVKHQWANDTVGAPNGPINAARLGEIEQGIFDAHTMPGCRVYHNAHQSITNNTSTALAFNSERYDTTGMHDPATNNSRITIAVAGTYLCWANVIFASAASGERDVWIWINHSVSTGTVVAVPPSAQKITMVTSTVVRLAAGDYVEVGIYQNCGSALNVESSVVTSGATFQSSPEFAVQLMAW